VNSANWLNRRLTKIVYAQIERAYFTRVGGNPAYQFFGRTDQAVKQDQPHISFKGIKPRATINCRPGGKSGRLGQAACEPDRGETRSRDERVPCSIYLFQIVRSTLKSETPIRLSPDQRL
jgi:hypothetical protein